MDSYLKSIGYFGLVVWTLLSAVLATVLNGWTLSYMWAWYVVPKFELPSLSVKEAMLLSAIVTFLTFHTDTTKVKDNRNSEDKLTDMIGWSVGIVIRPLIALGIFWVILTYA